MDASVRTLLWLAACLREDYGWISEAVIERRLRVTRPFAQWILGQVT